jgi:hypothetical protein
MEDARAALENQLATLAAVGDALAAEREAFLAAAERHAVELALQIAERSFPPPSPPIRTPSSPSSRARSGAPRAATA